MKLEREIPVEQAEEVIRSALQDTPLTELSREAVLQSRNDSAADLVLRVNGPMGPKVLVVEIKSRGEPRLARQAANQILRYCQEYDNAYGVFLAPYVSPVSARICAEQGIGYVDLSGNCRLIFGGIYIERQGRPNKFAEKRGLRTLYSPKASRVLRVLLSEPKRPWKVTEIVDAAGVSLGLVSNVKKLLGDREWLREENAGFALARPARLLAEWSDNYSFRKSEARDFYTMKPAPGLEAKLAKSCSDRDIRYALTAFSAATRMAPAVRYQRVFAYVDDIEPVVRELGLKKVASGANVTLLRPYDAGVFLGAREFEKVQVVSPVQAYLDLTSLKGRGEEAAAAILEEVIRPQW